MPDINISRLPPVVNLELYAGDGVAIKFTVKDASGVAFPLSGTIASQIKTKRLDQDPLVAWTVDSSEQAQGIVNLSLSSAQTASLLDAKGKFAGVWDLQFTPTGGEPVTLLQGAVTCSADVTH